MGDSRQPLGWIRNSVGASDYLMEELCLSLSGHRLHLSIVRVNMKKLKLKKKRMSKM